MKVTLDMHGSSRLKSLLARPWLLPDKIVAYFLSKLTHCARLSTNSFGWVQAILYSRRIDQWQRYSSVAQQVKALDEPAISVLDVGGGQGTIGEFLDPEEYRLCVLDIDTETLARAAKSGLELIAGDGCCMPFEDSVFDVVISVDSLEHVPDAKKASYCHELKRVAKRYVILHCPADSADDRFQGTAYDTKFLEWYHDHFKRDEPNTVEHLNSGLPKVEKLGELFPGASVLGKQNTEVWFKYWTTGCLPYIRFITGLLYKLCLQSRDDLPPYHACLLVWRKM